MDPLESLNERSVNKITIFLKLLLWLLWLFSIFKEPDCPGKYILILYIICIIHYGLTFAIVQGDFTFTNTFPDSRMLLHVSGWCHWFYQWYFTYIYFDKSHIARQMNLQPPKIKWENCPLELLFHVSSKLHVSLYIKFTVAMG